LREVLCHELAHLAVYRLHGGSARPHGPEWRQLMAAVGVASLATARTCAVVRPTKPNARKDYRSRFEHRCPVCQMVRFARRPVRSWRCAGCVAAGLPGLLTVTRIAT
jgi:predicted SprT family Zn-dependent metalloprotease